MAQEESPKERLDRELGELLQELRVALPGVQVLFAFLLTVPFAQGFVRVNEGQKRAYFVAFLLSTTAAILLIAPSVIHRLLFREGKKDRILFISNTLAIAGLIVLALAMTTVLFTITDVLYGSLISVITAAGAAVVFMVFWGLLPLTLRGMGRSHSVRESEAPASRRH